jgi:hypothetical protein
MCTTYGQNLVNKHTEIHLGTHISEIDRTSYNSEFKEYLTSRSLLSGLTIWTYNSSILWHGLYCV